MAISITRTDAKIGIETTPGRIDMESRRASLELQQRQTVMNTKTELPKVLIDQYEAFASAGLKSISDLSREWASQGYQQAMDFIAKTVEDGNLLARIENGGNMLANLAKRDSNTQHEFGLGFIPSVGPKFDVTGSLSIKPEKQWEGELSAVKANFIPGQLDFNYTPAAIRIYMLNYPSINMNYEGGNIDTYI